MFNIGPLELVVLAIVGVIVIGPDKLPNLARDAARMIRSLREIATGAQQQLRDELGPEFADVDLRNLNPKTALQRAVLGEDFDLTKYDPRRFDARQAANDLLNGSDDSADGVNGAAANGSNKPVSMDKRAEPAVAPTEPARPRPRPRPGPGPAARATPYDDDAT
ncbi:MAG TPA: Sec-independent protein translocase protein TatB [Jatrophihabitans sp.]|nr:Sec-independent protein translocase protein TatB [Jatrophihabitans sp.]